MSECVFKCERKKSRISIFRKLFITVTLMLLFSSLLTVTPATYAQPAKHFYAQAIVDALHTAFDNEIVDKAGPLGEERQFIERCDVGIIYKYKQYDHCIAAWFPDWASIVGWESSRSYYFHVGGQCGVGLVIPPEIGAFGSITAVKILYGTRDHSPAAVGTSWADIWISVDNLGRPTGQGLKAADIKQHSYEEVFQTYLNLEYNAPASLQDYKNVKILDCVNDIDNEQGHFHFHRRELHCSCIVTRDYNTEFGYLCPNGCYATIRVACLFHKPSPPSSLTSPSRVKSVDILEEDFEDLWNFVLRVSEGMGIVRATGLSAALPPISGIMVGVGGVGAAVLVLVVAGALGKGPLASLLGRKATKAPPIGR